MNIKLPVRVKVFPASGCPLNVIETVLGYPYPNFGWWVRVESDNGKALFEAPMAHCIQGMGVRLAHEEKSNKEKTSNLQ